MTKQYLTRFWVYLKIDEFFHSYFQRIAGILFSQPLRSCYIYLLVFSACKTTSKNDLYTSKYVGEITLSNQISNYSDSVQSVTCRCTLNIIQKDSVIRYDLQHSKCKGKGDKLTQGAISAPDFKRQQFEAVLDPRKKEIVWKDKNMNESNFVINDTRRTNFILGAVSPNYRFRGNKPHFLEDIFEPAKVLTIIDSTAYNISYQGDRRFDIFTGCSGKIVMQNPNSFWADSLHLNINRIHITSVFTSCFKREYQLRRVK